MKNERSYFSSLIVLLLCFVCLCVCQLNEKPITDRIEKSSLELNLNFENHAGKYSTTALDNSLESESSIMISPFLNLIKKQNNSLNTEAPTQYSGLNDLFAFVTDLTYTQDLENGTFALIDLLAVIITLITSVFMVLSFFRHKDEEIAFVEEEIEEEEEYEEDLSGRNKLLGILPAAVSLIAFIFTEKFSGPFVLADKYTVMMVIIMIIDLILAYITGKKRKGEKEEKNKKDFKLHKA